MRRVTYSSVLQLAATHFLGDPEPSTEDAANLNQWIRLWARQCWEKFFWPEWTVTEKRQFRDSWASGTTYGAPTATAAVERYYPNSQKYYQSLRGSNVGHAPATGANLDENSAWWAECAATYSGEDWTDGTAYIVGDRVLNPDDQRYYQCHTAHTASSSLDATKFGILTPFIRSIDFVQTGQTTIGDVQAVYDSDPRVWTLALTVPFSVTADSLIVWSDIPVVYVKFRERAPDYSGSTYSAAATYAVDDQIYFTDGDFWKCVTATTAGQTPVTHAAKWERLDFPAILKEAVAQGAYAQALKADGQNEKYLAERAEVFVLLQSEFDRLERQQNQAGQLNVLTR